MTNKTFTRPPFFFATWLDKGGSSAVRVRRPMEVLQEHGMAQGRFEDSAWPQELVALLKPDVLIWQRMSEDGHFKYMKECREAAPSAFHIYEIDDALDAVPEKSVHRAHMRMDIADEIVACAKLCDVVTVSTDDLAKHMRELLGPDSVIRIVPNMMAEKDFVKAADIRRQIGERYNGRKPRIGWGGGVSHKGDLDLLVPVIEHFGNRVDWVFLGMKPEVRVPVEFHDGVLPNEYIAKLASLDLDLMLAPLEDNKFNACKSNLRLLEGGVCCYPTIASPVAPYLTRHPPVVGYANTTKEWIAEIEKFLALSVSQQKKRGKMLHDWVRKFYNLDDHADERIAAWLPDGAKVFKPKPQQEPPKQVSVVGMLLPGDATFTPVASLEEALAGENDVLWLRPMTSIVLPQMHRMKAMLDSHRAASVSAMTNGTGETGFPNRENYFTCTGENAEAIDSMLTGIVTDEVDLCFPNGPAILLSRHALNTIGFPQLAEFTDEATGSVHEEAALYEWGIAAHVNGFAHLVSRTYAVAAKNCEPFDVNRLSQYAQARYGIDLSVPDICKPIRRDLELVYHKKFYRPTPVSAGNYQEWADVWDTISADDLAFLRQAPLNGAFYVVSENPQGAGWYRSVPEALQAAKNDQQDGRQQWLIVLGSGELRPHAIWMMDQAARANSVAIYGDHDYLDMDADHKVVRRDPDFKSAIFDHDLLLARDYVSPICALNIAHLDARFLEDSVAGVYGAVLDLVHRFGKERIVHVPAILFHSATQSVDMVKRQVRRKANVANKHAEAMGWAMTVRVHPHISAYAQVTYHPVVRPKVSIIVPTKDKLEMLQPCIDSIFAFTDYDNFEILIVDNGSSNIKHINYRKSLDGHPRIKLLEWNHPFNFSKINNYGAQFAEGEFLLLMNDDVRCLPESTNWLSLMVGCAEREHVGTVGAKLVHPWGTVQHIGVVDEYAMCGHIHHSMPVAHVGYQACAILPHEVTANTAACVLIRKSLYEDVGGLDETMPSNFGDVAMAHDVFKKGKVNICVVDALLQHFESVTRKRESPEVMAREGVALRKHWNKPDPYWNRNLSIMGYHGHGGMDMNLPAWPGLPHPWRELMDRPTRTVIVLGDYEDQMMRRLLAAGDHVFQATVSGFLIHIVHPFLQNVDPIDIRHPRLAEPILTQLGVDTIVLRSLRAAPLEMLGFLRALSGVEVRYVPITDERLTPLPGKVDVTQSEIDATGTEWGQVDLTGWRSAWDRFLSVAASVDLSEAGG